MAAPNPDAHSPQSVDEVASGSRGLDAASAQRDAGLRQPLRLERVGADVPRKTFKRGQNPPYGVRWFGARSFWGHLRHFVASAVATEDIDSRDWMTPDDPHELCARIARVLQGRASMEAGARAHSLAEWLGRDVWIDYVADTGDDVDVSAAVAALLVRDYVVPAPEEPSSASSKHRSDAPSGARRESSGELIAPRGDLLFFGGDTAYPVATAEEIHDRVVVPFNRVLLEQDDGKPRVVVAVPGNHDWYDGLDGFARLFRRRPYDQGSSGGTMHGTLQKGELARYTEFAKRFVKGEHVDKPGTLDLVGYRPVQSASYFILPLAPGLHLYAVDRQLRSIDYRQRQYFESWRLRHPGSTRVIALPDPPYHFGQENPSGKRMLDALRLQEGKERALVLSGDIHHYERWRQDSTSYVIAGGGGAFLHPAPVSRRGFSRDMEWPGPRQSKALLWGVPAKIAMGRSGVLPHIISALLLGPSVSALGRGDLMSAGIATTLAFFVLALGFALIGGIRRNAGPLLVTLAAAAALVVVAGPWCCHAALAAVGGPAFGASAGVGAWGVEWARVWALLGTLVISSGVASAAFGSFLAVLTWLGLENTQAFTALDHPGFKHFLRMRVRRDGSGIDVWCIGLVDPVRADEPPQLVDSYFWRAR